MHAVNPLTTILGFARRLATSLPRSRRLLPLALALLSVPASASWADEPAKSGPASKEKPATESNSPKPAETDWKPLFDGKTLNGWKQTRFGGDGDVEVVDGQLILHQGGPLTGVTLTNKEFPKVDFEISLEAQRVEGIDFFVGLTFPVRDSYASLIVGGWAGSVVGISSIDGQDAVSNETTQVIKFDNGKWYKFRLQVTATRIQAWIDDEQVINANIEGRRISTRNEVDLSRPVGLASFETKAAIRNIRYRLLKPAP